MGISLMHSPSSICRHASPSWLGWCRYPQANRQPRASAQIARIILTRMPRFNHGVNPAAIDGVISNE